MLFFIPKRMVFKPSLFAIFLTLITLFCLISLGRWQLLRADEKQAMLSQFEQTQAASPSELPSLDGATKIKQYQRLHGRGHYINGHNLLLDNQFHRHRFGFDVITPMQLADGTWLLVDRGWVPMGPSRQQLPAIAKVEGEMSFEGRAYYPSSKVWLLGEALDNEGQWPLVIEKVNISHLAKILHHRLYPFIIRLDSGAEHGFIREWKIVSMSPQRHLAYAVQWFAMAFVVVVIFIGWNLNKVERNE